MIRAEIKGLDGLAEYFRRYPEQSKVAERLATNDAAAHGLALARMVVTSEINLPPAYVRDPDKLRIAKKASGSSGEAVILANARPVSLARFATSRKLGRRPGGVHVKVKPGGASKTLKRGFLVPLKVGSEKADVAASFYNLGLAVRLKPGEKLSNKRVAKRLGNSGNVWLLYGPSVHQGFRQGMDRITPKVAEYYQRRYLHQLNRMLTK